MLETWFYEIKTLFPSVRGELGPFFVLEFLWYHTLGGIL
jgi:hypothetical protein